MALGASVSSSLELSRRVKEVFVAFPLRLGEGAMLCEMREREGREISGKGAETEEVPSKVTMSQM